MTVSESRSTKLPDDLEFEIESIWRREEERRGNAIFNGHVLSALDITPNGLRCRVVEYRHLLAQLTRPALYRVLRIKPVGVSGLFQCADGIVFGKRGLAVTQDPGLWELVPSGGLQYDKKASGGEYDYRPQIMAELQEEIGIHAGAVSSITPFCLVHDLDSHILDIGIEMVSSLTAERVLHLHGATISGEYEALRIVPRGDIVEFVREQARGLVGVSAKLIEQFLA